MNIRNILLVAFLIAFLTGCSSDLGKVIASVNAAPSDIHELGIISTPSTPITSLVYRVSNKEELTEAWQHFSIKKDPPKTEFDRYDYYFVNIRESSTCPFKLKNVTVNDTNKEINFYFHNQSIGSCTADATPKTVVVEVDKSYANGLENAAIIYFTGDRESRITDRIWD